HVAERVRVEGDVGRAFIEVAGVDVGDPGVLGDAGDVGDGVGPRLAAVSRHLDVAIVGAGPDHAGVFRRLGDGVDGRVHLGRGVVDRDAAGLLLLLLLRVVRGQVGGELLPRLAVVLGAEEELRAEVDRAGGADVDGRVPVEAELSFRVLRQRLDVARLVGLAVDAADVAALRLGIDVGRIGRVDEHPE